MPDKEVNTKESKLEAKNENAKQSAQAKIEKETMIGIALAESFMKQGQRKK
ncbi:MAG TPA: hypothetical protein PLT55_01980 [Acidimicrobiia bacterium]|nr:hypothetical protein [Acidimicrobiia bacterium]